MKTTLKSQLALLLLVLMVCLTACGGTEDPWDDAIYTTDTTLGEGATTIYVEVAVGEHQITVTVNTDETILADALLGVELIEGDMEQYGLYVKKVNGVTADYDVDQTYWALYIDGEYAPTGISSTAVVASTTYCLSREA